MDPQLHFLRGHSLAKSACNFVSHDPHPAAFGGHPPPSGEGLQPLPPQISLQDQPRLKQSKPLGSGTSDAPHANRAWRRNQEIS